MPEGHTIHRAARDHTKLFAGSPLSVSSPQGRFTDAVLLDGHALERVEAYGKHWFARFDHDIVVHVHLGLFGKFWVHKGDGPARERPNSRMRWATGGGVLDLTGPTACVAGDEAVYLDIVKRLGPDPLRRDADPDLFVRKAGKSARTIGQLLMDQAVVAGVGNVYRAEVLFVHGIWPETQGRDLDAGALRTMWATLVAMLEDGVKRNRIVTVDPSEARSDRRDKKTYVYKRDACLRCGSAIRRWDMAGRWCYACPTCQT